MRTRHTPEQPPGVTIFTNDFIYLYILTQLTQSIYIWDGNEHRVYIYILYIGKEIPPFWLCRLCFWYKCMKSLKNTGTPPLRRGRARKRQETMKESKLTGILVKSFKNQRLWAYKIPDAVRGPNTRFLPTKPFDIVFFAKKGSGGIEVKQLNNTARFCPAREIRPSQVQGLNDMVRMGRRALVIVGIHYPRDFSFVVVPWVFVKDNFQDSWDLREENLFSQRYQIKNDQFDMKKFLIDWNL